MDRRTAVPVIVVLVVGIASCADSGSTIAPTTSADMTTPLRVERDLPFATYDGTTLTLDLWVPPDPSGAPIVFGAPGRNDLVRAGAIAVDIQTGIPDPPDDEDEGVRFLGDHGANIRARADAVACAIRFARARAAELGSDDPIVVLAGLSEPFGAAAHIALFGATVEERWDEFAAAVGGPPRQVECLVADGSTRVDALVGTAGTYDLYVPAIEGLYGRTYQKAFDPELQEFLASAVGAHPELIVRLFHGTADRAIPVTVSEDFKTALAAAGYDVELTLFDGRHDDPPDEVIFPVLKEVLGLTGG